MFLDNHGPYPTADNECPVHKELYGMADKPKRNKCVCDALRWPRSISPGHDVKCPVHKTAFRPPTEHLYPKERE